MSASADIDQVAQMENKKLLKLIANRNKEILEEKKKSNTLDMQRDMMQDKAYLEKVNSQIRAYKEQNTAYKKYLKDDMLHEMQQKNRKSIVM
jgi:hypothetical protein